MLYGEFRVIYIYETDRTSLHYCFSLRSIDLSFYWSIDWLWDWSLIVVRGLLARLKNRVNGQLFNLDQWNRPKHLINRVLERHRLESYELDFWSPQALQFPRLKNCLKTFTMCPRSFAYRRKNSISGQKLSRGHEQPTY